MRCRNLPPEQLPQSMLVPLCVATASKHRNAPPEAEHGATEVLSPSRRQQLDVMLKGPRSSGVSPLPMKGPGRQARDDSAPPQRGAVPALQSLDGHGTARKTSPGVESNLESSGLCVTLVTMSHVHALPALPAHIELQAS
mmetsp:Transcript_19855/g.35436  ORF Transcript_19855/g.35436 Transcript_19855/m.35436 type:complete len:140 (-) Transcript_19855:222-641(-)